MNGLQWRLTGEMFIQAVRLFDRDRLPYPIRVLPLGPTETPPTAEEYERVRVAAAQRLAAISDENLHRALRTLLEPQVRVEVHGAYDRGFERIVRIHAGLAGQTAALAVQEPGPTKEYGADIHLLTVAPQELAARIVSALPRCAPGRFTAVRGTRADIGKVEYARHPTRISRAEEITRILRQRRSGVGEIGVFAGPAIDSRPTGNPHGFHWLDHLPQDGRYLLIKHNPEEFTLAPGTPDEIARRLQHGMDTVRTTAPRPETPRSSTDASGLPRPVPATPQVPGQAAAWPQVPHEGTPPRLPGQVAGQPLSPSAAQPQIAGQAAATQLQRPGQVAARRELAQEDIDADDRYFQERNRRGWLT
ncbi:ESX secretion-associated protein EspG [Nocardia carnea]|uniref:ESX secretion-associated protein EspG n=1 Tax=Nocardia carnea TaxID=37328 RepID=UPI002455387D|nr:ESX secretion-associated protein EspG [Nocardia carnea]